MHGAHVVKSDYNFKFGFELSLLSLCGNCLYSESFWWFTLRFIFLFLFFMYICVRWGAGHMCVGASAHQGPKLMSEIILCNSYFIHWSRISQSNPELVCETSPSSPLALRIPATVSWDWSYRCATMSTWHLHGFLESHTSSHAYKARALFAGPFPIFPN